MSPTQRVFNEVRKLCADLYGEDNVYTYIPAEAQYPFIHIGNQTSQNARVNKDYIDRDTQLMIHVWHDDVFRRGDLSAMLWEIEKALLNKYENKGMLSSLTTQIIEDGTTSTLLMHGILDVAIRI